MPIRHTTQGWFWGSKGPFPTREKAGQVARAAYAHGYGGNPEEWWRFAKGVRLGDEVQFRWGADAAIQTGWITQAAIDDDTGLPAWRLVLPGGRIQYVLKQYTSPVGTAPPPPIGTPIKKLGNPLRRYEVLVTQGMRRVRGGVLTPNVRTFTVYAKTAKSAVKAVRDTGISATRVEVREVL